MISTHFFVAKMIYAHFFFAKTIYAHFYVVKTIHTHFFVVKWFTHTFLSWKRFTHFLLWMLFTHTFLSQKKFTHFFLQNELRTSSGKFLLIEICHPKSSDFLGLCNPYSTTPSQQSKKVPLICWLHGQWHVCPDLPCRQENIKPSPSSEARYAIIGDLHQPEQHPCYRLVTWVLRCQPGHYIFSYVALYY